MTYQEVKEKIYNILHHVFGANAVTVAEGLSLQEAYEADSLDAVDMLNDIYSELHVSISDDEYRKLESMDGEDIMLITFINFFANKLGVVIPEDKKRFETQMRALKKGEKKQIQIPETRYIPNIDAALANIDKNIKQITADSVARNIILNKKNIFLTTYQDVKTYVYNTIRKSVLISNFNDNSNLINDMDLSEMDCLYIIMECEKHFQITIPNQEIRNIKTVRDITDAVCKVRGIKTPAQIAQEQFDATKQNITNTNSRVITK